MKQRCKTVKRNFTPSGSMINSLVFGGRSRLRNAMKKVQLLAMELSALNIVNIFHVLGKVERPGRALTRKFFVSLTISVNILLLSLVMIAARIFSCALYTPCYHIFRVLILPNFSIE